MAISVIQQKVIGNALSGSFTTPTTAGNCVVVIVNAFSTSTTPAISGVTLGGSAGNFTAAVSVATATFNPWLISAIWVDPNCAGSQTAVAVSGSNLTVNSSFGITILEVAGLVTSSVTDKTSSSSGNGTSWTSGTTATTTVTSEIWIAADNTSGGSGVQPGSPWTDFSFDANKIGGGYQIVSSTGTATFAGTQGNGNWAACVAALKGVTTVTHSGTATLTGSGTLQATGAFAGSTALSGSGTLSWSGSRILKATVLSGSGTLSGNVIGTLNEAVTLSGSGTLTGAGTGALFNFATLTGAGSLSVPGVILGNTAVLSGTGTLSIVGTGGTVQAAAGVTTPQAYPGTSQVSVAAPGSTSWQYLGTLGLVTALTYSFTCPGGADQLTCTVMIPASYRTQLLNPGWQVRVTRGGHVCWTGKLDEPQPSSSGWTLTAVGDGNRGTDFRAVYSGTWPAGMPDAAVNAAIARGLPWVNPGIGTPAGIWLGQAQDSGSMTVTDLLNLVCTRGALTWYANSQPGGSPGTDLFVFPLPTAVNRLLIVTDPVPRTLGGDINSLLIRYEIDDGVASSTSATFGTTTVQNAASVAAHGVIEDYVDLSSAGVMSAGSAQAVGNNVLAAFVRASFAGPWSASYGQLLNAGGVPIDPGTDQAGTVVRLILTDWAAGGEVSPAPITALVGGYSWDDFAQQATITPYANLDQSLSGLLSMESTVLTPITVVA